MSYFSDETEFDQYDPFLSNVSDNCFEFDMIDQYDRDDSLIEFISTSENTSTAQSILSEDYPYILDLDLPDYNSNINSDQGINFEAVTPPSEPYETTQQQVTIEQVNTPKQVVPKRKYTNKNETASYNEKISKSREAARKFRKKQIEELEALQKRAEELTKENQIYAEEERRMIKENESKRKEAEEMYQKLHAS